MTPPTTNAGIVTDETSGDRQIPESVRADGSTRKAIKIRPGYRPPEDVELYRTRNAAAFRDRAKRIGIPGTEGLKDTQATESSTTPANNKNAKRRDARRKAKDGAEPGSEKDNILEESSAAPDAITVDPEIDREKKARGLKKKLKQAKDLKEKKDSGEGLLPEQVAKVIKINELIRELELLGFDQDGEVKEEKGVETTSAVDEADVTNKQDL